MSEVHKLHVSILQNKMTVFRCFAIIFLHFVAYCPGTAVEIKRFQRPDNDYNVEWRADLKNQNITFQITAKTLGYVGFGLSVTGGMKNADIVIGGVNNGKPYFSDYHGEGNWRPEVDVSQDWILVSACENSTHTMLEVSRVFNTCDEDDVEINNDTIKFIWSIGGTDEITQHQKHGAASVIILNPETHQGNLSGYDAWEIRVKTNLPDEDTIYWCTAHKSPPYTTKRHIIGFKVLLESAESRNHTHHLILHHCMGSSKQDIDLYERILKTSGGLCYEDWDIFQMKKTCEQFVYGWAIGADPPYLPENVGIPLNEHGTPEYFLLEVHYDNPNILPNLKYETGVIAYTTTDIREHDAGILRVGHQTSASLMIPPSASNYVIAGHCGGICTANRLPYDGINVFTVFLHSHLAGRKMKLRQFRNGTELPWLAYDNHYDFNFQQNRLLSEYRKIFKGDHLTYECTDESINRTPPQAVLGGLSTQNEMCLAFLMYYPRVQTINYCESRILEFNYFLKKLGIEEIELGDVIDPLVKAPPKYANMRYSKVLSLIPWDDTLKLEIQNLTRFGKHVGTCQPEQRKNDDNYEIISYPEAVPYFTEDVCRRT